MSEEVSEWVLDSQQREQQASRAPPSAPRARPAALDGTELVGTELMRLFASDRHTPTLPAGHRFPMEKYRLLRRRLLASGRFGPGDVVDALSPDVPGRPGAVRVGESRPNRKGARQPGAPPQGMPEGRLRASRAPLRGEPAGGAPASGTGLRPGTLESETVNQDGRRGGPPMKLAHTMIRVRDLERSIDFYTGFMGLREVRRKDLGDDATLVFLADEDENHHIELTHNKDGRDYELGDQFGHLAFTTDDLEAVVERVEEKGWWYRRSRPDTGSRYIFIKDPDGYDVEILQARS